MEDKKDPKYQKFLEQEARKERYEKLKMQKAKIWEDYQRVDKEMERICPPKRVKTYGDPCVEMFD